MYGIADILLVIKTGVDLDYHGIIQGFACVYRISSKLSQVREQTEASLRVFIKYFEETRHSGARLCLQLVPVND